MIFITDHNSDREASTMFTGFLQQMEEPSTAPRPSFQSHSAAVLKVVAAKSLYKSAAKVACKFRNCRKCTIESCPGKKEIKYCSNQCQNCELVNLKGEIPKTL
jgi:hypothetical protein